MYLSEWIIFMLEIIVIFFVVLISIIFVHCSLWYLLQYKRKENVIYLF